MPRLIDDRSRADRVEYPNELCPGRQVFAGFPLQFGSRVVLAANFDDQGRDCS